MPVRFPRTVEMLGGSTITGIPNPVASTDVTPKSYVDSAIEGLSWKDSARVAAPSNINLASPGSTIDSLLMVLGNRVVVPNQIVQSQNGIYIWNGSTTPMTRSLDASIFGSSLPFMLN